MSEIWRQASEALNYFMFQYIKHVKVDNHENSG